MGVEIMVNFNNPYFALNPSEFWRRWHISLSTWLRDYLYIPLGGNRKGPVRTYINLGLTMLLGGLWHGAAWNFVVWGAYQGALLIVHRLFSSLPLVLANRTRTPIRTGAEDSSTSRSTNHEYEGKASPTPGLQGAGRGEAVYRALSKLLRIVIMFHAACIGWLLFRAHSLDQIGQMLKALGHGWSFDVRLGSWAIALIILCLPLWLVQILQERTRDLEAPMKLSLVPRLALVSVVLVMLFCLGNNGGAAFIYFQF
jgi:D-alanyl-lipoteichoic acid acyltransferase DltB (MBOAT superfamily)